MSSEAALCDNSHRNHSLSIVIINGYLFKGINKEVNPNKTKLTNKTPANKQTNNQLPQKLNPGMSCDSDCLSLVVW